MGIAHTVGHWHVNIIATALINFDILIVVSKAKFQQKLNGQTRFWHQYFALETLEAKSNTLCAQTEKFFSLV